MPGDDHVITDVEAAHTWPDGFDNAGGFMAHDRRQRDLPFPVEHMTIGAAHTSCSYSNTNFTVVWLIELERLDSESPLWVPIEYGSTNRHLVLFHSHYFFLLIANVSGSR